MLKHAKFGFLFLAIALLWPALTLFQAAPANSGASTEGNIARVLARILEQVQYSHQPFDDNMSRKFLVRYIEGLDPQHLNFFASDIDEFQAFATSLDELTKAGDTLPAHTIYDRFLHRVQQRAAYVTDLLKSEPFEFSGQDQYVVDRKREPWPKTLDAAHQLWRQRARFEYLQEKLNDKSGAEITESLRKRYQGLERTVREMKDEDGEIYLSSLAGAYDPHSVYLGHEEFENLNISMKLSLV
ncbi:MAG TPA: tail-specific protease, partial [Verrucomicrobiae bacterium]